MSQSATPAVPRQSIVPTPTTVDPKSLNNPTPPASRFPPADTVPQPARNLCLLVVANMALTSAWLNTVNNTAVEEGREDDRDSETDTDPSLLDAGAREAKEWRLFLGDDVKLNKDQGDVDQCWHSGKGLSIWDATAQGVKGPPLDANGVCKYDVVMITAHALQSRDPWVTKMKWQTVIADEGHEFLRGQHNKSAEQQSHTLHAWRVLQTRSRSMFILSGTPFVTKISYDFVAMTKAVAREEIRAKWDQRCTDIGLRQLVNGWISVNDSRYVKFKDAEDQRRTTIAELLSTFMIRRTEKSAIRGKPIIKDYFKLCVDAIDAVPCPQAEIDRREILFKRRFGNIQRLSSPRNQWLRCVSFSERYIEWEKVRSKGSAAARKKVWDGFEISECDKLCRARALVQELREAKKAGQGVVIFSQRTFLSEWALMVILP
jgi:hypothetical protein